MSSNEEIRRVVPKGTVIFREGEPGDCAYVIERGIVEISTRNGSEDIIIARRGSGEIFGEMAVVDNRPRSATVTAAADCELLLLSANQLHDRMASLDPVLRMVLTVILDRFRDTMERFKSERASNLSPFIATSGGNPDLQIQAAQGGHRAHRAGAVAEQGDCPRRAGPPLPAACRRQDRPHRESRSPDSLAAPQSRPDPAGRLHRGRRAERPDLRDQPLRHRQGLPSAHQPAVHR